MQEIDRETGTATEGQRQCKREIQRLGQRQRDRGNAREGYKDWDSDRGTEVMQERDTETGTATEGQIRGNSRER